MAMYHKVFTVSQATAASYAVVQQVSGFDSMSIAIPALSGYLAASPADVSIQVSDDNVTYRDWYTTAGTGTVPVMATAAVGNIVLKTPQISEINYVRIKTDTAATGTLEYSVAVSANGKA